MIEKAIVTRVYQYNYVTFQNHLHLYFNPKVISPRDAQKKEKDPLDHIK